MFRVLIVDDEPVIRKGITSFIDWENEGITVDDQYANGAEALSALEKHPYDILITDIKMPLLGGIELTKKALELYPWLKVILISNYSDFEYVKEGLKLGAVDYLLKLTLKKDDLLAVLRRCITMLREERKKDSELNHYQQEAVYLERKRVEQEMKRLIVQEQTSYSSTAWAPAWLEHSYACVYLMLDGAEEWRENHGFLYMQFLLEEWQKRFYEQIEIGTAMIVAESSMFLILPNLNGADQQQQLLQWKQLVEKEWDVSTSAGIVTERGINSIIKGFTNSFSACQRRFFEGPGRFYHMNGSETGLEKIRIDKKIHDWKPFFEMISNGDPTSSAIEYALKRWNGGALTPEQVKQEACSLLTGTYRLLRADESMLPVRHELLFQAETIDQMVSLLVCQLGEIRTTFTPKLIDNGYDEKLIRKALEYIASHYTENITLQSVADIVHLSKSYFSLYFKKQTGRNFVDYLIDLRIREAKRLLVENENRIYDVAEAAGFKDVKYFSKVFKKVTGLTPMAYREKHQVSKIG
ncbi:MULTISPECIES: response regulator transcription factor [Metabacillus]|uniref:Response regulator n=1 Tax=Metabacillus hrfriensis TaxID=3048891 RepID=A0ACD4R5G7_9BACI|nr:MULTISPECIES: response regulator [Metabacillus]UAL50218.1 response regulator [Metabacillus dongyingensis]WHZ55685.1 response regulator [Metabacillus sp. CT-WN-B3]